MSYWLHMDTVELGLLWCSLWWRTETGQEGGQHGGQVWRTTLWPGGCHWEGRAVQRRSVSWTLHLVILGPLGRLVNIIQHYWGQNGNSRYHLKRNTISQYLSFHVLKIRTRRRTREQEGAPSCNLTTTDVEVRDLDPTIVTDDPTTVVADPVTKNPDDAEISISGLLIGIILILGMKQVNRRKCQMHHVFTCIFESTKSTT